ncbi:hypothetical protein TRIATDRAFT_298202 [Trichoderma atroviride IMI 206040]|uniref:Uncharacterized protein n=1 Tax=Hypocrea atroviridis (strain ATCC 20476 / IMI 206040) TaxID=452589 RepID=G9NM27_HYPAI|nr:uncharacterized protein TRIATDRAFT_298202 [Trichoderma atroviride IMI 206040]EHK47959.1 hypothetical protein TRIATDRAFT_298202 [Trichoderma atroviride IMI 206040]
MGQKLRQTCGFSLIQPSSILVDPLGSDLISAHHPLHLMYKVGSTPSYRPLLVNVHWYYICPTRRPLYPFFEKFANTKMAHSW